MPQLAYLSICLMVGYIGIKTRFGFWGAFLGSILATPLISLLVIAFLAPPDPGLSRTGRKKAKHDEDEDEE